MSKILYAYHVIHYSIFITMMIYILITPVPYREQKFEITDYMDPVKDLNLIKHRGSESKINNG